MYGTGNAKRGSRKSAAFSHFKMSSGHAATHIASLNRRDRLFRDARDALALQSIRLQSGAHQASSD